MDQVQMLAGSVAGIIFAAASWNMLVKAWRTKDLRSYSLGQIALNNIGNLFYWFYVASLPLGPIWFMHTFFTLVSLFMLILYFIYRPAPKTVQRATRERKFLLSAFEGARLIPFARRRSGQQELECLFERQPLASFPGSVKKIR
jgi:hypothetical protein